MGTKTQTQLHKQRMSHLARANKIRLARSTLKSRIACGEVSICDVLADVPEEAVSWPVGEMLIARRYCGPDRMRKLLVRLRIGERRPIGLLTERQRRLLTSALDGAPVVAFAAGEVGDD